MNVLIVAPTHPDLINVPAEAAAARTITDNDARFTVRGQQTGFFCVAVQGAGRLHEVKKVCEQQWQH